jgi:hypothetical protein
MKGWTYVNPYCGCFLVKNCVFFFVFILFYFIFFIYLFKGLFCNFTSNGASALFFDNSNTASTNGQNVINCSFENMTSGGIYPIVFSEYRADVKYNVTDCFFRNLSNINSAPDGGAMRCDMSNSLSIGNIYSSKCFCGNY